MSTCSILYNPINTPENFAGGKIFLYGNRWKALTGDKLIHDIVAGNVISFDRLPTQDKPPHSLVLSCKDQQALDLAMLDFIGCGVVEECTSIFPGPCFYSNIFPVIKKDGSARIILNLRELNEYITFAHFKMETIADVLPMISPNCYFMTIDFKHAYFSVYVKPDHRKWLRFLWKDVHYQFASLPQGLSSAPRLFTKLLKPALAYLRNLGMLVSCYIDDCIFIASSKEELLCNVNFAMQFFDSLGLTININKSVLVPTQRVKFLGVVLDSVDMVVALPDDKTKQIRCVGRSLLTKETTTLLDLSSFIGLLVFAGVAVPQAPLHYKYLEIVRNLALIKNKGDYKAQILLDLHSRELVRWWVHNITSQSKSIVIPPPDLVISTDASLTGWGAKLGSMVTGGNWSSHELDHINCLELKAVLLGLQSLCKDHGDTHIRLRSDNTTVVACIDRCASTKLSLLTIIEQIFEWANLKNITLSAEYIKGTENIDADRESRIKNIDTEWMLDRKIFSALCDKFFVPDLDLFASRINAQLHDFVSWKPDPDASYTNAFTIPWSRGLNYAFPPFSIVGRMLQKLQEDRATLLVILPLWPTRVWFPRALQLLVEDPVILPRNCLTFPQDPSHKHPRSATLRLAAMILSGSLSKIKAYRRKLQPFYLDHGEMQRNSSIGRISRDGCYFVSRGKLIHFNHL